MKKLLICLLAVIGFIATANAQTVVVQNNQGGETEQMQDPNIFYINGIPSTQDIGGVETIIERVFDHYDCPYNFYDNFVVFTNYHSYTVTVLYQVIVGSKGTKKIGSIVLKAEESKKILIDNDPYNIIHEIATITRKL